ncbi:hypothetical protein L1887_62389 [Cichorium endivia]|nr:hypothetical protein L1887_62389 [Cichorium endivia]
MRKCGGHHHHLDRVSVDTARHWVERVGPRMSEDGQDVRALRRGFEAVTQGTRRFGSRDEVLRFYAAPLARLFGPDQLGALQVFGPEGVGQGGRIAGRGNAGVAAGATGCRLGNSAGCGVEDAARAHVLWVGGRVVRGAGRDGTAVCAANRVARAGNNQWRDARADGAALRHGEGEDLARRNGGGSGSGTQPGTGTRSVDGGIAAPRRAAGQSGQRYQGRCAPGAQGRMLDRCNARARSGRCSPTRHRQARGRAAQRCARQAGQVRTSVACGRLKHRRVLANDPPYNSDEEHNDNSVGETTPCRGKQLTQTSRHDAAADTSTCSDARLRSHAVVAASAHVMGIFIPPNSPADESDSDTDTEALHYVRTLKCAALSRVSQSPVLAWAWATYLLRAPVRDRLDCLTAALERWADTARLARVLVDEELFLSTLIVCILASIASGSRELEDALVAVAHSRAVLDGVSAHLAHADPLVRRTGMLVGELLSERTARPGGKTLSFGAAIWNGTGEGREEARVLRALYHAWSHHSDAIAVRAATFKPTAPPSIHCSAPKKLSLRRRRVLHREREGRGPAGQRRDDCRRGWMRETRAPGH